MRPEDIIIAPVITEKSNEAITEGKYTFEVNKKATKVDIANAVEKLFEVKVLNVNTISSSCFIQNRETGCCYCNCKR